MQDIIDSLFIQVPRKVVDGETVRLAAKLYMKAIHQPAESRAEKKPIFRTVPFIEIYKNGVDYEVYQLDCDEDGHIVNRDLRCYQEELEQLLEAKTQTRDKGTQLKEWGYLALERVAQYMSMHINYIEDLAGLSDAELTNIGLGAQEDRAAARAFLKSRDGAVDEKLAVETEALKDENIQLREDLNYLKKANQDLVDRLSKLENQNTNAKFKGQK